MLKRMYILPIKRFLLKWNIFELERLVDCDCIIIKMILSSVHNYILDTLSVCAPGIKG